MQFGAPLRMELHCHNKYSNYRLKDSRFGLDCGTDIPSQLYAAKSAGLSGFILTNHNTLDGYKQLIDYQKDHPMLRDLMILQGMELSMNPIRKMKGERHPHMGVLCIDASASDKIPDYARIDEALDFARSVGAVSVAEHPFDVSGAGLMNDASKCDLIEGFNSNNMDMYSNLRAQVFAAKSNKYVVSGSDSHLSSTMGRSTVTIYPRDMHESDVGNDEVRYALLHGNFVVDKPSYNTIKNFKDVTIYHFSDKKQMMGDLRKKSYGPLVPIGEFIYNRFEKNPDRKWVDFLGGVFLKRMRSLSKKVNMYGYDDGLLHNASLPRKIIESVLPTMPSRCAGGRKNLDWANDFLRGYDHDSPHIHMNKQNDAVRGRKLEIEVQGLR